MFRKNPRFMKKWSNVTWKSSLGLSVIPSCISLECDGGFQQLFLIYSTPEAVVFFFLKQEAEFKSIKTSSEKLYLSVEKSLIVRLNQINPAVFLGIVVFFSVIMYFLR